MISLEIRKTLRSGPVEFRLDLGLDIAPGALLCLYGRSGAGKTTLLRCLAGLEQPDAGSIRCGDEIWFDGKRSMAVQRRRVGFVFQDYALFPNMTVRGNLEFALRPGSAPGRVDEMLELMGLGPLQQRKPDALSGGQRQRVGLARALVSEPQLLLLDEPFSALDPPTRSRLQDEILAMHRRYRLTTVMVSHDAGEIFKLADRVAVIEEGRLVASGKPAEIFAAGQGAGKFSFIGQVLAIEPADVVFAVSVLVGNQVVRVIATAEEAEGLSAGCRVKLWSKAFNPALQRVSE